LCIAYRPESSQEYASLIFDFSFFNREELLEKRISDDPILIERDQDLKDTHLNILRRFYNVFESIVNYHKDLSFYLNQLDDGVFIQLSIEVCFPLSLILLFPSFSFFFLRVFRLSLTMRMESSL